MKKKVTISGSISGVISTGSFQNLRPGFTWEEEIEDCTLSDEELDLRRRTLYERGFMLLKEVETQATIERIQRERANIRFRIHPETKKPVPSVTSVINWDADFFVSAQQLVQYASQSNIVHSKVEHYISTKKWVEAKELEALWADIVIVSKGDLQLEVDTGSFPKFLEKFPIKDMKNAEVVYLEDSAGLPDFWGIPEFAEKIPTTFDVKRTPDKIKDGIQLSAYCKAKGHEQGVIVPLNNKTAQGYNKPIIYDKKALGGYYRMYEQKREAFRKRYGI